MTELHVDNVTLTRGGQALVQEASFDLHSGELVALLGPNGAGKTSLLRTALGYIRPDKGQVTLGGTPVQDISALERARNLAYLPQQRVLAWPNKVQDVVALGRYAFGANISRLKDIDADAVKAAMQACDITHLKDRATHNLSGGELARVHCARAFATKAPLLIADEPVAALDPRHQFRVMSLVQDFVKDGGGALVVLHDIALAAQYAERLIWMKDGRIVADGSVEDTLSAQRLADIYGVRAHVEGRNVQIKGALISSP